MKRSLGILVLVLVASCTSDSQKEATPENKDEQPAVLEPEQAEPDVATPEDPADTDEASADEASAKGEASEPGNASEPGGVPSAEEPGKTDETGPAKTTATEEKTEAEKSATERSHLADPDRYKKPGKAGVCRTDADCKVQCVRAPCPRGVCDDGTCRTLPAVSGCAVMRCRKGTRCVDRDGKARCVPVAEAGD